MISRLFVRLYLLLVVTLIGVSWGLDRVFESYLESSVSADKPDAYRISFDLVFDKIRLLPLDQLESEVENLEVVLHQPLFLEKLEHLLAAGASMEDIGQDEVITLIDSQGETFHRYINGSDYVLTMGPIDLGHDLKKLEYSLAFVFYACLALAVFFWIWPLWKNLSKLSKAATAFGNGHFHSRAIVSSSSVVATLADTFNAMASRIQRLIDSHKELTNAVSHDLRTPIARLRFGIEMLQDQSTKENAQRYIDSMGQDIDELDSLVAEMLTYATFDRDVPEIELQQRNVHAWLNNVVEDLKHILNDKNIEFKVADFNVDQQIGFAPKYMERAVTNLMQNAAKYGNKSIEVTLDIRQNHCYIYVDDDGAGIPASERNRVFDAFVRLDSSRARKSGGFGLGLAIVRRIIEWHNGSIEIDESPLGGARMILAWPLVTS